MASFSYSNEINITKDNDVELNRFHFSDIDYIDEQTLRKEYVEYIHGMWNGYYLK